MGILRKARKSLADEDPKTGECQPKGLGAVFQGGGTGGATFWVGDVGAEPPHGTGPGKFPPWVPKEDNGETDNETEVGELGIPTARGSNGEGGL